MINFRVILFVVSCLGFGLILSACGKQYSPTDLVAFTNINTFMGEDDLAKGNRKTVAEMPRVRVSHVKHENAGVQCIACHHKKYNDSRIKQCHHCHKGIRGVEDMHKYCITCHQKMKAPTACAECHTEKAGKIEAKTTSDYDPRKIFTTDYHTKHTGISCQVCHHKEKGTKDLKKCSECHSDDVPRMKMQHYFCRDCHVKGKKGPVTCTECHK